MGTLASMAQGRHEAEARANGTVAAIAAEAAKQPTAARQVAFLLGMAQRMDNSVLTSRPEVVGKLRNMVHQQLTAEPVVQHVAKRSLFRFAGQATPARPSDRLVWTERDRRGIVKTRQVVDVAWNVAQQHVHPGLMDTISSTPITGDHYSNGRVVRGTLHASKGASQKSLLGSIGFLLSNKAGVREAYWKTNPAGFGLEILENEATFSAAYKKDPLAVMRLVDALGQPPR